jgi:hypothetical protein
VKTVQGSTARPESHADEINRPGWGDCTRCEREFELDSSPHLDHCWSCAEIIDAETDLIAESRATRAELGRAVDRLNAVTDEVTAR